MSKLFTFGCSYSEDYDKLYKKYEVNDGTNLPGQVKYIRDFLDGVPPKSWPQVLADMLSMESINYAKGGDCNEGIFQEICLHSNEFQKDDIVIIQWTHLVRYRWPMPDRWVHCLSGYIPFTINNLSPFPTRSEHDKIIVSRDSVFIVEEIYAWQKMIEQLSTLIGFKLYFWSRCERIINSENENFLRNRKYILNDCIINRNGIPAEIFNNGGLTIDQETNGVNPDGHMGKSGHEVQAKLFYDYITNRII